MHPDYVFREKHLYKQNIFISQTEGYVKKNVYWFLDIYNNIYNKINLDYYKSTSLHCNIS